MIDRIYYWLRDITSRPDERGERSAGYLQNKIRQKAIEISRKYDGRLLEVGCGEGLFLSQLVSVNPAIEAWGVDNWTDILVRARQLFEKKRIDSIHLVEANALELPFEDSFFDVVMFINVVICMDGLSSVKKAFKEIERVLKPGGRIVLEFRNRSNFFLRLKYRFAKYYDATAKDHPLSTYYEKDIKETLTELGFKLASVSRIGFFVKRLAPVIIFEAYKGKGAGPC